MAWKLFDTMIIGNSSQILLDDQFLANIPGEELPELAWFGVRCRMDTEGRYWNQAETDTLNKIESDQLALLDQFGNDRAVYVRRRNPPGNVNISFTTAAMRRCTKHFRPYSNCILNAVSNLILRLIRNGRTIPCGSRKRLRPDTKL